MQLFNNKGHKYSKYCSRKILKTGQKPIKYLRLFIIIFVDVNIIYYNNKN